MLHVLHATQARHFYQCDKTVTLPNLIRSRAETLSRRKVAIVALLHPPAELPIEIHDRREQLHSNKQGMTSKYSLREFDYAGR